MCRMRHDTRKGRKIGFFLFQLLVSFFWIWIWFNVVFTLACPTREFFESHIHEQSVIIRPDGLIHKWQLGALGYNYGREPSGTNSLVRELMIPRKRSKRHADETRLDDCDFFGRNPPPVGIILVQFHRYHLDYQQRLGVNPDQCCKARKFGSKRQNRLRISVKMYPWWIRSFWQNEEIKDIELRRRWHLQEESLFPSFVGNHEAIQNWLASCCWELALGWCGKGWPRWDDTPVMQEVRKKVWSWAYMNFFKRRLQAFVRIRLTLGWKIMEK